MYCRDWGDSSAYGLNWAIQLYLAGGWDEHEGPQWLHSHVRHLDRDGQDAWLRGGFSTRPPTICQSQGSWTCPKITYAPHSERASRTRRKLHGPLNTLRRPLWLLLHFIGWSKHQPSQIQGQGDGPPALKGESFKEFVDFCCCCLNHHTPSSKIIRYLLNVKACYDFKQFL